MQLTAAAAMRLMLEEAAMAEGWTADLANEAICVRYVRLVGGRV